ncbi:MAG: transposase family protein, partial [bacterium]|nr:transposase family protein [bacterium]
MVTADHIVSHSPVSMGIQGERAALVVKDRGTGWLSCYPVKDKSGDLARQALQHFRGSRNNVRLVYTDGSLELKQAVAGLGLPHGQSLPERPETNGVAERAVRSVLEGARTALEHAGFPVSCWPFAAKHFAFAYNITWVDGDCPWQRRHQAGQFPGKLLPFGCLVSFSPQPSAAGSLPKWGPKGISGLFLGYFLQPGGRWSKGYRVVALSEFDAYDFHVGRFGHKPRVQTVDNLYREPGEFVFPLQKRHREAISSIPPIPESAWDAPLAGPDMGVDDVGGGVGELLYQDEEPDEELAPVQEVVPEPAVGGSPPDAGQGVARGPVGSAE